MDTRRRDKPRSGLAAANGSVVEASADIWSIPDSRAVRAYTLPKLWAPRPDFAKQLRAIHVQRGAQQPAVLPSALLLLVVRAAFKTERSTCFAVRPVGPPPAHRLEQRFARLESRCQVGALGQFVRSKIPPDISGIGRQPEHPQLHRYRRRPPNLCGGFGTRRLGPSERTNFLNALHRRLPSDLVRLQNVFSRPTRPDVSSARAETDQCDRPADEPAVASLHVVVRRHSPNARRTDDPPHAR